MKNLYIKEKDGTFTPIKLELAAVEDLVNKLILITVGTENCETPDGTIEYIRESFIKSEVIIDAMRRSQAADILIIPHTIRLEFLSKREIEEKTVCIRIDESDNIDNLPEIKAQVKKTTKKEAIILPSPISINEYKEIRAIKERIKIRKQRHGGALIIK